MHPFCVTDHAALRFIQRHASHIRDLDVARSLLDNAMRTAKRLPEPTHAGDVQWYVEALDVIAVSHLDRDPSVTRKRQRHLVVTVLPRVMPAREQGADVFYLHEGKLNARSCLLAILQGGPRSANDLVSAAETDGISGLTVWSVYADLLEERAIHFDDDTKLVSLQGRS